MATISTGRRQYDVRSGRIIPNVMPTLILTDRDLQEGNFLTFMARLRTKTTRQEKFNWDVDDFLPTSDTTDGTALSTDENIQVDNPSRFAAGQVWRVKRTGELLKVISVNLGTSQVRFLRGISALNSGGGTAAAAIQDADTLIRLMPSMGEDSRRQPTQTTVPTQEYNYCQAIRYELEMSRRQRKRSFLSGESEWSYQVEKALLQARKDMNGAFLANERGRYNDSTDGDVTLTQGMLNIPTTNSLNVNGGTLYKATLDEWMAEEGLRYGPRNKVLVASLDLILAITEMYNDLAHFTVPMTVEGATMGVQVMTVISPNGGQMMIVEDRFLTDNYNGDGVLVSFQNVERMVFSNHGINDELHWELDTADPDDMGGVQTLIGDFGLSWGDEKVHGLIQNATGGGAKGRAVA
jgi:hypothetical protein